METNKVNVELLDVALRSFEFFNEQILRKYATNNILIGSDPHAEKEAARIRMTQLYKFITHQVDNLTEDEREEVMKDLARRAVTPSHGNGKRDDVTREDSVTEAAEKTEKTDSKSNSTLKSRDIKKVIKKTEKEINDEEAQETAETQQKDGISSEKEKSENAPEKGHYTRAESSKEGETQEIETFENRLSEEKDEHGRVKIPASRIIAFDEELKGILKKGNEEKGGTRTAMTTCQQKIGEFYRGSTEVQLSDETGNHKHRNVYISNLRKIMQNERGEFKARVKDIKRKLRDEVVKNGKVVTPQLDAQLTAQAKAEAGRIMEEKKKKLLEEAEQMVKEKKLKEIPKSIRETAAEAGGKQNQSSKPDEGNEADAETAGKLAKDKTSLIKGDGLEGIVPDAESVADKEENEEEKSDFDRAVENGAKELKEELENQGNEENEVSDEEETPEELQEEYAGESEEDEGEVQADGKTKVLTPEEIQAASEKSDVVVPPIPPSDEDEEEDDNGGKSLAEMTFETDKELVMELEKYITKKGNHYGFHEYRDEAVLAVVVHFGADSWAKNKGSVHKWLDEVVSNYNARVRAEEKADKIPA